MEAGRDVPAPGEDGTGHGVEGLLYGSSVMRALVDAVDRLADTDVTVLIRGESGVGKELVARRIHERSKRPGPFVKVSCGAIPEGLLEAELFGAEAGAYTDAVGRKGRFLTAAGGTLLLDEVVDMPIGCQAALLRVLQDREIMPLGASEEFRVDVRVLATTNRDVATAVAEGRFRKDLYYRLNVLPLVVPPLRRRSGELPMLLHAFLDAYARKYERPKPRLTRATLATLMFYPWPGNVRELRSFAQRAVLSGDLEAAAAELELASELVQEDELDVVDDALASLGRGEAVELKEISRAVVADVERRLLARVLERTDGDRRRTADQLHISTKTLRYKIRDYGLAPDG